MLFSGWELYAYPLSNGIFIFKWRLFSKQHINLQVRNKCNCLNVFSVTVYTFSTDHWHALPGSVPLIHSLLLLEWKEITKEFFICEFLCGLLSLLIFLCVWHFLWFLKLILSLTTTTTKNHTVATVLNPLAEVQVPGCFATLSSTSLS